MDREQRYGAYMGIMIGLLIGLLLLLLGGCQTTYHIEARNPETGMVTVVTVKSFREFEQPNVTYSRTDDGVTFAFGAESANTANSPIESAVADVIRATPAVILPVPPQ